MIAPPRLPSHDALAALIKEARARQLRRRLFGAAAIAVSAAIALSVYATTMGGVSRPASGSGLASAGAPPCLSSQRSAGAGFVGATGSMLGGVTITNRSGIACSIPAAIPAVSVSWRGTPMPVETRTSNPQRWPSWEAARVVLPGAQSVVLLQWWNYCGPGAGRTISPTFELRLAQLAVRATADETTPPFCNASDGPSTLYVSRPLVPR